jgi:hypothetical protein
MAQYYKNVPDDSFGKRHRTYGVVGTEGSYSSLDDKKPVHPVGEAKFTYRQAQEDLNFHQGGFPVLIDKSGNNPTELFRGTPATLTVVSMVADKRVRPHMMTVMALAQQDHPHAQIVAGSSLTKFSSALSKNAVNKGIAVPHDSNPDMLTDAERTEEPEPEDMTPVIMRNPENSMVRAGAYEGYIPQKEVMAGKQFLKQMLRPTKQPTPTENTPTENYKQPRLPGM